MSTATALEADPTVYGVTVTTQRGIYSLCGNCVVDGHHRAASTLFEGMDGPCERCHAAPAAGPHHDVVLTGCGNCRQTGRLPSGDRCGYCDATGRQTVARCRVCRGEHGEQPNPKPGVGPCRCPDPPERR